MKKDLGSSYIEVFLVSSIPIGSRCEVWWGDLGRGQLVILQYNCWLERILKQVFVFSSVSQILVKVYFSRPVFTELDWT